MLLFKLTCKINDYFSFPIIKRTKYHDSDEKIRKKFSQSKKSLYLCAPLQQEAFTTATICKFNI